MPAPVVSSMNLLSTPVLLAEQTVGAQDGILLLEAAAPGPGNILLEAAAPGPGNLLLESS